jgi:hypothetical protein
MTPVLMICLLAFDIASVKSEPDLTKRSELALTNADRAMDEARTAVERVFERLQEIHDELLSDIMSKRKKP